MGNFNNTYSTDETPWTAFYDLFLTGKPLYRVLNGTDDASAHLAVFFECKTPNKTQPLARCHIPREVKLVI